MPQAPRTLTAEAALDLLPGDGSVAVGTLSAEPLGLTRPLAAAPGRLGSGSLLAGIVLDGSPLLSAPGLRLRSWFAPASASTHGTSIELLPLTWYQAWQLLKAGPLAAALVMVSPPDADGNHSLGISAGLTSMMVRSAGVVIAQVNRYMPRTRGDSLVPAGRIDALVAYDEPLPAFAVRAPRPEDIAAAEHMARLVPEGAVLQVGVGTIPDQVVRTLARKGRRGIQVQSVVTEGFRDLAESDPTASAVASEVLGSASLYEWVGASAQVEMAAADRTHAPGALPTGRPFVALNAALEVDLFGQANMDMRAGRQVAGVGGSLDFAMAASAEGGAYVVGLPAVSSAGRSRIVPLLRGPVSVSRTLVMAVATQCGLADLRGLDVEERARALIGVAAPEHRAGLREAWRRL